jgi:hypothetical protein
MRPIVAHKEEIGLFFDGDNTTMAYLGLLDLYEAIPNAADGTDSDQPKISYSLCNEWRTRSAQCAMDDILYDYPQKDNIHDLVVNQD